MLASVFLVLRRDVVMREGDPPPGSDEYGMELMSFCVQHNIARGGSAETYEENWRRHLKIWNGPKEPRPGSIEV